MADHVDPVAARPRGPRPSRRLVGQHDFITPSLPTPAIARPTVWMATQQSVEEVLAAAEELEAAEARGKELQRRVRWVGRLLAWLARFGGETWQQRWHASGADQAAKAWSDLVTDIGACRLIRRTDAPSSPGRRVG
jgi:hypothetical protein